MPKLIKVMQSSYSEDTGGKLHVQVKDIVSSQQTVKTTKRSRGAAVNSCRLCEVFKIYMEYF